MDPTYTIFIISNAKHKHLKLVKQCDIVSHMKCTYVHAYMRKNTCRKGM